MSVPRLTLSDVLRAVYGPKCTICRRRRTTNPLMMCSHCLGDRACIECKGTGIIYERGALAGCFTCEGTGTK